MAHSIPVKTAQNVTIDYPVASLGDRIIAFIIDGLIKTGYTLFVIVILSGLISAELINVAIGFGIVLFLPMIFYSLLFEIFYNGQTPGKRSMDIKVVSLDGSEVTVGMFAMRWVFRLIDSIMSWIVAIIVISVNEKGQRVGDIVAGTSVISLKKKHSLKQTAYKKIEDTYEPVYPQVTGLTSYDISTIKEILSTRSDKRFSLLTSLSAKIEETIGVTKDGSSEQFLRTIIKDYNYFANQETI